MQAAATVDAGRVPAEGLRNAVVRRAILALVLAVAAWRTVAGVLESPSHVFSEHRLMPTFLFLDGLRVYGPPAAGPHYVPMYPPLSFLYYLPAAVTNEPVTVLRIAGALAAAAVLAPCALLLWSAGRGRRDLLPWGLATLAAVCWIHASPVLLAALFVHADAPALLFAAGGVWLLHLALSRDSRVLLAGAVALCSLAPWAKQTFVPVVLLPVLALLARAGVRRALVVAVATAAFQLVLLAAAGSFFGFRDLLFWILEFASRHPWSGPPLSALLRTNRVLLVEALPLVAIPVAWVLAAAPGSGPLRAWARDVPGLLLVAGLLLWPTSVLGGVKVGGALNALVPALFFFTVSCFAVALASGSACSVERARAGRAVLIVLACVLGLQGIVEAGRISRELPTRLWDAEVVAGTLRAEPGKFFFPWYPLSTYLATGKLVPCDLGISDRKLAGIAVPREEVLKYVPPGVGYVVCGDMACPTTLESFVVLRTTTEVRGGRTWNVHQVVRPSG